MEYEIRFYYPKYELQNIIANLNKIKKLTKEDRIYEKTMQFDHPCENASFYTKEIDGRFRIRMSKSETQSKCKISWKRRIPTTYETMFIIENVLKMKSVESYERYRTIYFNKEIEISVDEYPFGIALEIENKSSSNPEENIKK